MAYEVLPQARGKGNALLTAYRRRHDSPPGPTPAHVVTTFCLGSDLPPKRMSFYSKTIYPNFKFPGKWMLNPQEGGRKVVRRWSEGDRRWSEGGKVHDRFLDSRWVPGFTMGSWIHDRFLVLGTARHGNIWHGMDPPVPGTAQDVPVKRGWWGPEF